MGIITWIQGVWKRMFRSDVEKVFGTDALVSEVMEAWITKYDRITEGKPEWQNPDDQVRSINFAKYIDDVTAGLVTLDLGIALSGSIRADWLQKQADYVLSAITDKTSEALGNVGIMFKPNGQNVDYIEPGCFFPTATNSNGDVLGCIFVTRLQKGKKWYSRFEWHRFEESGEGNLYAIGNRAFVSNRPDGKGKECSLQEVPEWSMLQPDVYIRDLEKPLYAYFKNPASNTIDRGSSLGVPIWHNCIRELRDLDIAWSRKGTEIEDSKHITFLPQSAVRFADMHNINLPRMIQGVEMGTGVDSDNNIHEHVATLLTEQRIKDINSNLAMISTKCGFSQGMFQLDEKTGMMTATQVEADDQETIRTVKNIRDALKKCMDDLLYALNAMADLYSLAPAGPYEVDYSFGDITYSYQEDMQNWWKYRVQGDVPPWMYYVKFEGMSEEEAKKMVEEAQPEEPELFGGEE